MRFAHEIEEFLDSVGEPQLSELRECYEKIRSSGDADRISEWIHDCFESRSNISRSEFEFSQQVAGVMHLFADLGGREIKPFSDQAVRFKEKVRIPNWDNLPAELQYLKEPADTYGIYQSEQQVLEFLEIATQEDMEALSRIAEQMRSKGDWHAINEWINNYSMEEHEESWRVHWLLGMLDHAGLLEGWT